MSEPDASRIDDLIERSSLGTDGARSLRDRTDPVVAREILADDSAAPPVPLETSRGHASPVDEITADLYLVLDRAGLDELERDVVILRISRRRSAEEAGVAMGLRAGEIRRIQRRALDKIRRAGGIERPPAAAALVGHPDAEQNVIALFERDPRIRTILAALYREYLGRGTGPPRALSRDEARRCMGFASPAAIDAALQKVQRAIWGEQGHAEEIPYFLVNHRLLRSEHQMIVPHRGCNHRDSASDRFRG